MLEAAIEREMAKRRGYVVVWTGNWDYRLKPLDGHAEELEIGLYLYKFDDYGYRMPEVGSVLYFSENSHSEMAEGLRTLQFSAEIGSPCARLPHDFLQKPVEFLIYIPREGDEPILLEEVYG